MKKMTIQEASAYLGVSKEAIHNRVRRGSLEMISQNDTKYVLVGEKKPQTPKPSDDRYTKFLEEQNQKLSQKIDSLEDEAKNLREQKEQMLRSNIQKIEQIYKDKDEQLKNIIDAISNKFILESKVDEHIEAEITEQKPLSNEFISLKKYLKSKELSSKKIKKMLAEFSEMAKVDARVITIGKKCYISPNRYDYSDILVF